MMAAGGAPTANMIGSNYRLTIFGKDLARPAFPLPPWLCHTYSIHFYIFLFKYFARPLSLSCIHHPPNATHSPSLGQVWQAFTPLIRRINGIDQEEQHPFRSYLYQWGLFIFIDGTVLIHTSFLTTLVQSPYLRQRMAISAFSYPSLLEPSF